VKASNLTKFKKLNDVEGKDKYGVEASDRFAALENIIQYKL
jgi:hypothetical protein